MGERQKRLSDVGSGCQASGTSWTWTAYTSGTEFLASAGRSGSPPPGALEAFAETGYDGTSVRELSRRLGVSHALLIARFGSKEGLWFAAMEHALKETEKAWRDVADSPGFDDLEALRQGIVRQVIFSAAHPEVLRIMNHEGAIDSPRVRFRHGPFRQPAASRR